MDAMARFIEWVRTTHSLNTEGDEDWSNVVLTAHYGSCHDHLYLLRTMMSWGIEPPGFRLADSFALFKWFMVWDQHTNLASLVTRYANWLHRIPHDADSDARALRVVVMTVFPNTAAACYTFSVRYNDTRLVVRLPMSSAARILRTQMRILLLPRDGSGASARSHLLPPPND